MLGAEGVATAILQKLETRLPAKVTEFRTRYGTTAAALPMPASLYSTEVDVLSVDKYPAIIVTTVDTTGRIGNRQLQGTGEVDVYQYKYRMRVFLYVTGTDHGPTDLLRKRYALAAREVLLTNLVLVDADGQYALLEPNTVKESYSDVATNQAQLLFAGVYVEFEVTTAESLAAWPEPLPGDVEIVADVGVIPAGMTGVNP